MLAAGISLLGLYGWIAGILGLVHVLRPKADAIGLVGGAVALLGIVSVSNIVLVQLVRAILERELAMAPDAVAQLLGRVWVVSYPLGPTLPGGLFLLACGLLRVRVFPVWMAAMLLLGAMTFPAGRVFRLPWLLHVSDLVLTLGSVGIAWRLWQSPEPWAGERSPSAERAAPMLS